MPFVQQVIAQAAYRCRLVGPLAPAMVVAGDSPGRELTLAGVPNAAGLPDAAGVPERTALSFERFEGKCRSFSR